MGFFQATNGIDSKANVLVSGSVFGTNNATFTNTISGSNISASGDIIAGDDVFVKNMDTGAFPERIVAISANNGQLFYVPTASFQIPATVEFDIQTAGTASFTAVTTPSVAQLNGGVISIIPATTPMLQLDLSSINTNYTLEIISVGNGTDSQRMNLQIRTPNTGNGWNAWLTGYYTDLAQSVSYNWINNGNGNTLYNTKSTVNRRLDSSSRTFITIDISNKAIVIHCTNISD